MLVSTQEDGRIISYKDRSCLQATKEFIEIVNEWRSRQNAGPLAWTTAVRFLMARKFDVKRALVLYQQHEAVRDREGLVRLDPSREPLKSELETGKFTVLPVRDTSGAAIALFTACKHFPLTTSHQTTLQGVVYQLDVALDSLETQRCGIVFIYDMTNSKYGNFDYDLSQKILTLLKGGYPARLKKVLIVTAPLWFKASFRILRLFVREKLRDRVTTVSLQDLHLHVPEQALPKELGGKLDVDHHGWLLHCLKSVSNRYSTDLYDIGSPTANKIPDPLIACNGVKISNGSIRSSKLNRSPRRSMAPNWDHTTAPNEDSDIKEEAGGGGGQTTYSSSSGANYDSLESSLATAKDIEDDEEDDTFAEDDANLEESEMLSSSFSQMSHSNLATVSDPSPTSEVFADVLSKVRQPSMSSMSSREESLHIDDGRGMTLTAFIEHVTQKSRKGLVSEYADIKSKTPDGTFDTAKMKANQAKNRYTDVLCLDHSRVKLSMQDNDPYSDYINANFVDGYKQHNAFICTQGPLPKTFGDFWRMVWEQQVLVIVMTTRVIERGRPKCGLYWPVDEDSPVHYGPFTITTQKVQEEKDYTYSLISLTDTRTDETREVHHLQFTSWPDYGVPLSAGAMLDFLQRVREIQKTSVKNLGASWSGHPQGPPILVHCSAGIGRTGTFCTLDICIQRLADCGMIDVRGTVERIRSQRAFSIQMPDQYVFCHLALLEHAVRQGLVSNIDISAFDDDASDSE